MINIVKKLITTSPRYAENESKAADLISEILEKSKIAFVQQPFESYAPVTVKAELFADNEQIPCIGSSLNSGEIKNGDNLISSFGYEPKNLLFNINFSPITDEISVVDFYQEPSVSISRKSVVKIVMANTVKGSVKVKKQRFRTKNILVGNTINPTNIIFAHFDSIIGDGAVDNAGSVAVLLDLITKYPDYLSNSLFIFSGNEEMSYDQYKKSGYGFRVFETEYQSLLDQAKQILVLDGIGVSNSSFVQFGLDWVLRLKSLDKLRSKVFWLQNDQSEILKYFHTKADKASILSENFLKDASDKLQKKLLK